MVKLTDLPNELLSHIFSYLPSRLLLGLLQVSLRIHNLTIHILLRRIHNALILDDHHLIFECYPPSAETTTPYLHCAYLGTWRLPPSIYSSSSTTITSSSSSSPSSAHEPSSAHVSQSNPKPRLIQTPASLYSHFLPTRAPSASTHAPPNPARSTQPPDTLIPNTLSLDTNTLFTPLTAQASLVKVGPKRGLFTSVIEVFEKKGMRVHRSWLRRAEEVTNEKFGRDGELSFRSLGGEGSVRDKDAYRDVAEVVDEGGEEIGNRHEEGNKDKDDERIIWVGDNRVAGIKVRVREKKFLRQQQQLPLLMPADEEPAATYVLYYESLMIRTVHLLLVLEQSWEEQAAHRGMGGMAVVWGSAPMRM